jgi:hypothetical protein
MGGFSAELLHAVHGLFSRAVTCALLTEDGVKNRIFLQDQKGLENLFIGYSYCDL